MASEKPFDGAEPNLRRLLDKNAKDFSRFAKKREDASNLEVLSYKQETERCIVYLLQMVNVFLYGDLVGSQLSKVECKKSIL